MSILIGHCRIRSHLSLLGAVEDRYCPRFGEEKETSGHLRLEVFDVEEIRKKELYTLPWNGVITFIRRSRFFEEKLG